MIVVTVNGKTTVVSGWRAWLLGAAGILVLWVLFSVLAVVLVGAALSAGLLLLLLIPAAALMALGQSVFGSRRLR